MYRPYCDRVSTFLVSYDLGMPFAWDQPVPEIGNGRRGTGTQQELRLTVIDGLIHYYQRTPLGEEEEIQPVGSLDWLPQTPTFLYPPATEEQLSATEEKLGFPLPPLLRALYHWVANGGFGPGYGLLGVMGGGDEDGWHLPELYLWHTEGKQSIGLSLCERRHFEKAGDPHKYVTDWEIIVPPGCWPDRLLPISHTGCGLYYYLNVPTDQMFYGADDDLTLRLLANSFVDFFDRWMLDDLWEYPERFYYPSSDLLPGREE